MKARSILGRLRREGLRSVVARALDHAADRRRERSYRPTGANEPRLRQPAPVLNLLGFPPRRSRGGVALQWLDRLEEEARLRCVARLYPLAARARLEIDDAGRRVAVDLGPAWADDPARLRVALERAFRVTGASTLHVETFADLPIAGLDSGGRPTIASIHDFSAATEAGAAWLGQAHSLIFASSFARRAFHQRYPRLERVASTILPPAIRLPVLPRAAAQPSLRVAFAGALSVIKGADLLPELIAAAHRSGAEFQVYGAGDDVTPRELVRCGARAEGWYCARSLARLLVRDGIDLCVLPSRAEETHCLVIDECWWAGVPVLVSDRGALPERVAPGGGTSARLEELPSRLAALLAAPLSIERMRSTIPPPNSPERVADSIRALYQRTYAAANIPPA